MLTVPQIVDILQKNPSPNKRMIPKAISHEKRVRLHSATTLNQTDATSALTELLNDIEKILPSDKFQSFKILLKYPIPTVDLTDRIYSALEKLFDGRNPVFDYEFTSEEDASDWEYYRTKVLNQLELFRKEGFERMKTAINSIMIVDLDLEQVSSRPNPYMYFLNLSELIDLDFVKNQPDKIDWIIFKQPDKKVAVFCDEYYRVFNTKQGNVYDIDPRPVIEVQHDIKYCPARFFWSTAINVNDLIVKKSPLSNQLGRLDMLFFYDVSNEHLNLYGRYPIYSVYASGCKFTNPKTGHYCYKGHLKTRTNEYLFQQNKLVACPACEKKRLDGAGSVIEIDPPSRKNDHVDLSDPVKITGADVKTLEYNNEDLRRRENKIYNGVTGFHGLSINDKAINEKQVIAIFESLETALRNPQQNFEAAIKWADETICKLRYGSSFVSASISLGTEHYLLTPSQIMSLYKEAKDSSLSVSILDFLEDRYFETEFRNNPEQIIRHKILANIDLFRHLTLKEVQELRSNQAITFEAYYIKANFSSLIAQFERENVSVVEFGKMVSFEKKIQAIREALNVYALEYIPKEEANNE